MSPHRSTCPSARARSGPSPEPADARHGARRRRRAWICAWLVGLPLAGCTGTDGLTPAPPPVDVNEVELTSDGLALVRSTKRSRLWVRPDHNLGRYDDVLIAGIGFQYGRGQERLDPAQEEEIGQMLEQALIDFTKGTPVGIASEPGECVVAVELALKDIYLHTSETTGSSISYVSSFGSATMIVEFRDSLTNTPLVRYAANRGLGGGPGTGQSGANLARLGKALGEMVTDMTTELQSIVPTTTVRRESECNDGIYKLTGRG